MSQRPHGPSAGGVRPDPHPEPVGPPAGKLDGETVAPQPLGNLSFTPDPRRTLTTLLNAIVGIDHCAAREGAERILRAGWRPPAQRIETAEQLDALPQHAVIRRGITIYQHIVGDGWWIEQGVGEVFHSEQIIDIADGDEIVVLWAGGDS